ncbi:hypothetical protein J4E91_002508 [Alternaria rosae]|nr:hypothetical protein J4E91_002508 [Alternaria rosae]
MNYKTIPPMPGTWPEDATDPMSPLTFTLDDFISAAGTAQTYIETTLNQYKSQVWLNDTMTNMTLFTFAEELVTKSASYVTYISPFLGSQITPPLIAAAVRSNKVAGVAILREILRYSRGNGLDDKDVMTVQNFKGSMEIYRLTKSFQGMIALYLELANAREPPSIRILREADVVAFVDALPTVDAETAVRDDVRCPFCWGAFGTDEDECRGVVKQVGCCGKRFGRDCLVEAIKGSELCPNCRRDFDIVRVADEEGS